jgi:hypothetical protein
MQARRFYVITGGTSNYVAPHFALSAPAYGRVGKQIRDAVLSALEAMPSSYPNTQVSLIRTKMALGCADYSAAEKELFKAAGVPYLETNEDLEKVVDALVADPTTKGIIMAAAVCDWSPAELDGRQGVTSEFGKRRPRLKANEDIALHLVPSEKIIQKIRKTRKDIFLVGFKATTGKTEQEQYIEGLRLLKGASCNLVFSNDLHERRNMVITPEEAKYVRKGREASLNDLVSMTLARSNLHFTRSHVIEGDPIPWDSEKVPANLRKVVNHLVARGAYKPFNGKTVGHFATRGPKDGTIYTSRRHSNFNNIESDGLLKIVASDDDNVVAFGGKPSVGGQSQRIIFKEHPDVDCIVHAHVPLKPGYDRSTIPSEPQKYRECGSHECGQATSDNLRPWPANQRIKAVMLEEHGPNICFSRDTDPDEVIRFIETRWDLEGKTGGPVEL